MLFRRRSTLLKGKFYCIFNFFVAACHCLGCLNCLMRFALDSRATVRKKFVSSLKSVLAEGCDGERHNFVVLLSQCTFWTILSVREDLVDC